MRKLLLVVAVLSSSTTAIAQQSDLYAYYVGNAIGQLTIDFDKCEYGITDPQYVEDLANWSDFMGKRMLKERSLRTSSEKIIPIDMYAVGYAKPATIYCSQPTLEIDVNAHNVSQIDFTVATSWAVADAVAAGL